MDLVLNTADFSAKNIGQKSVGYLSTFTKTLLLNMTKYEITDLEAFAFERFYANLSSTGIWSKINKLYLPVMAGNLSQTLYDVILNNGVFDAVPSNTLYSLDANNGLVPTLNKIQNKDIIVSLGSPISLNDFSAACFVVNNNGVSRAQADRLIAFSYSINHAFSLSASTTYYSKLALTASDGSFIPANGITDIRGGYAGVSKSAQISTEAFARFFADGKSANRGSALLAHSSLDLVSNISLMCGQYSSTFINSSIGCFMLSKNALSDTEMATFATQLERLMDSLGKTFNHYYHNV